MSETLVIGVLLDELVSSHSSCSGCQREPTAKPAGNLLELGLGKRDDLDIM